MRVFYDATLLGTAGTGLERFCRELLSGLAQFDLELTALTAHPEIELPAGVEALPIFPAPKGDAARVIWQQTRLPLLLRRARADVYYSPAPEGMFLPSVRQVISVHDVIPLIYPEGQGGHATFYRRLLPLLLRRTSALVTVSHSTKRDLERSYPFFDRPIRVAYQGYRRGVFYPRDPRQQQSVRQKYGLGDGPLVLFLGEARPYKNIGRILEGFARSGLEAHRLVVAGRLGDQETSLRRKVEDLGLGSRVQFLGFLPDDDLAGLYSSCQVFVFASLYEGFGIPPLEAMACGVPVVLSNRASLPEVGGDAAVYVDPESPQAIADGVRRVALDPALQASLRQKSLARAQQFDYKNAAQVVYQTLAGQTQPTPAQGEA